MVTVKGLFASCCQFNKIIPLLTVSECFMDFFFFAQISSCCFFYLYIYLFPKYERFNSSHFLVGRGEVPKLTWQRMNGTC